MELTSVESLAAFNTAAFNTAAFNTTALDATALDRATMALDRVTMTLRPVCASQAWISRVASGRPYASVTALQAAATAALAELDWADIVEALSAHPRIGDRVEGQEREASWSRQEQAGASNIDVTIASGLIADNVEYEQRFGHVFLICATGMSAPEMLAALKARLGNDEVVEREVVREELTKIVDLRLAKTFTQPRDASR